MIIHTKRKKLRVLNTREKRKLENEINKQNNSNFGFGDLIVLYEDKYDEIYVSSRKSAELSTEFDKIEKIGMLFARRRKGKIKPTINGRILINKTT